MYHVHVNASIRFKAIQHNSFIDTVYIYQYIHFFFGNTNIERTYKLFASSNSNRLIMSWY